MRIKEMDQSLQIKLVSVFKKKTFVPSLVCFRTFTYFKYIFQVKIKLFMTSKSDQDQDPHGSALVFCLDPHPH